LTCSISGGGISKYGFSEQINWLIDWLTNAVVHSVNTRHKHNLHKSSANLSCFQNGTYYAGIKIFNNLPFALKSHMNEKAQFKITPKWYLTHTHSTLLMNTYCLKMTYPYEGYVNSISWQYWCIYVDVFLNSSMCNHCVLLCENFSCTIHMFLYLYDIFHILQSFLTNPGSRECNVI
jgi:hypothetical protein